MNNKSNMRCIAAALAMMILILDSKTAFRGAGEGIRLCLCTVIPAVFPFLFLSAQLGEWNNFPVWHYPARLLGIPSSAVSVLIPAFVGGYPAGAQSISLLHRKGLLPRKSAERMLAFCSNVGPSFIFGILPLKFPDRKTVFAVWIIQIFSAWAASLAFRPSAESNGHQDTAIQQPPSPIECAIAACLKICGWIILFRILIQFLERWIFWLFPVSVKIFLIGILELSNGCCMLDLIGSQSARFIIGNTILAFGGICVAAQTASVCSDLSIRCYILGKLMQSSVAALTALLWVHGLWYCIPTVVLLSGLFCRREKKYGIPQKGVV